MTTGSDIGELAGYRALVTGGTQGIGAAVAARLRMSPPRKAARLSQAP
jgi:NAD(P)-dependent dehydrogenase (short-subunit alcohol dehydrogenase family)